MCLDRDVLQVSQSQSKLDNMEFVLTLADTDMQGQWDSRLCVGGET